MSRQQNAFQLLGNLFGFLLRVVRGFIANQGILLSGGIAYFTLLSIVPLSIVALIVLTHFIEERWLILTLSTYLEMAIPGYATTLTEQAQAFLKHRRVIGVIVFFSMLFFSSTAFTMLENAMSMIFSQRNNIRHRPFLISAIIPYVYILVMGIGVVLVSLIVGAIETLESRHLTILGWNLNLGGATGVALYILGILGEVLILTSVYLVMPAMRVKFRHALIGGITSAVLWEITRRILVWYYSTVSIVNVIYGSLTITIVALLSIDAAAIILLFGAQVIAELAYKSGKTPASKHLDAQS